MKLSSGDYKEIKKFSKDYKELSDSQIAKLLVKTERFKEYDCFERIETLRRGISFVRTYFKMRSIDKLTIRKTHLKHIKDLLKKYPEINNHQLANKLIFRTNLKFNTARAYISNYKNYGSI